jgi:hypothetical protein
VSDHSSPAPRLRDHGIDADRHEEIRLLRDGRTAAGETKAQIAGIAESTPARERKPSLLEIYE